jgi:hypothetical protein
MKRVFPLLLLLAACSDPNVTTTTEEPAPKATEPALETDPALLEAALVCTGITHPEHEPVLLVHGTGTYGQEQWSWNYIPYLTELGYDVCTVTYPDRGLIDQQISAEYVVHAVRRVTELSGSKVDMVGHSQGGSMPRWAIKWWPSVQAALDDFVMLAAPNHGTELGSMGGPPTGMPEALWQFGPSSMFVTAMNTGDETPGDISYTSIYTLFDELVQPQEPESTSTLESGAVNPNVSNILLQDTCPGRPVDHLSIGLSDEMVVLLVVDALSNAGPADIERAGGLDLCLATQIVDPVLALQKFQELGPGFMASFPPGTHDTDAEPPLKPYATGG